MGHAYSKEFSIMIINHLKSVLDAGNKETEMLELLRILSKDPQFPYDLNNLEYIT